MRGLYRRILPSTIREPAYRLRRSLADPDRRDWMFDKRRWLSSLRMVRLRNRYAGERCFILGNGPSLAKTDLARLKKEHTFALNRGYLLFPRIGFSTTFLVSADRLILQQFAAELSAQASIKFINWRERDRFRPAADVLFVFDPYDRSRGFATRPWDRIWEGSTVTFVALQLAYFLGFAEVILLGVDHSYPVRRDANTVEVFEGPDPYHFDKGYIPSGTPWMVPDPLVAEESFRLARGEYERVGRTILDATVEGRLEVFTKIDLETVL